jgi:hypothetical protein
MFVRPAADAETLLATLEGVEGSLSAARASMAWVEQFAARTPFQLGEVASAFVRLRALGMDARRFIEPAGEAASALGVPLSQAVEAFTDAATGEFERLKEFGITASREGDRVTLRWQQNGREMSRTISSSNREMVQSTLAAIWNSRYAGNMARRSRTWQGMVSNLQDTWTRFATRVMNAGAFDWMKRQLEDMLGLTGRMENDGSMQAWAQSISASLVRAGEAVKDLLLGQRRMLNPDTASEMGGLAMVREGGLLVRLNEIGDRIGGVFERVHQVMRALFGDLDPIETALLGIAGISFAPLIGALGALGVALALLAANPKAMLAMAAITALGLAGKAIYDNWDGIADWFGRQMDAIGAAVQRASDAITRLLSLRDRLSGQSPTGAVNDPAAQQRRSANQRAGGAQRIDGFDEEGGPAIGDLPSLMNVPANPAAAGAGADRVDLGGTLRIRIEDNRVTATGRMNDPRARLDINQGVVVGAP